MYSEFAIRYSNIIISGLLITSLFIYGINYKPAINAPEPALDAIGNVASKPVDICASNHGYISVDGKGRLGNVIAQYATLFGLSKLHPNLKPVIEENMSNDLKKMFKQISIPSYKSHCVNPFKCEFFNRLYSKKLLAETGQNCNIKLVGHPISVHLFAPYKNQLQQDLTLSTCMSIQAKHFLEKIAIEKSIDEPTFVGVHIRRTDYEAALQKDRKSKGFYLSKAYYWSAMDHFRHYFTNVIFVIASDDQEWCHQHFANVADIVFTTTPKNLKLASAERQVLLDMSILISCHHSIISFGTFSFWSAYLKKQGTVIHVDNDYNNIGYDTKHSNETWTHWIPLMDPCVEWKNGEWIFLEKAENCTK